MWMLTAGLVRESWGRSSEVRKELRDVSVRSGLEEEMGGCALHSSRAAGPVAIVEVEAFALEDECADAVLYGVVSWRMPRMSGCDKLHTRLLATVLMP
jgi:hypothetical protein